MKAVSGGRGGKVTRVDVVVVVVVCRLGITSVMGQKFEGSGPTRAGERAKEQLESLPAKPRAPRKRPKAGGGLILVWVRRASEHNIQTQMQQNTTHTDLVQERRDGDAGGRMRVQHTGDGDGGQAGQPRQIRQRGRRIAVVRLRRVGFRTQSGDDGAVAFLRASLLADNVPRALQLRVDAAVAGQAASALDLGNGKRVSKGRWGSGSSSKRPTFLLWHWSQGSWRCSSCRDLADMLGRRARQEMEAETEEGEMCGSTDAAMVAGMRGAWYMKEEAEGAAESGGERERQTRAQTWSWTRSWTAVSLLRPPSQADTRSQCVKGGLLT